MGLSLLYLICDPYCLIFSSYLLFIPNRQVLTYPIYRFDLIRPTNLLCTKKSGSYKRRYANIDSMKFDQKLTAILKYFNRLIHYDEEDRESEQKLPPLQKLPRQSLPQFLADHIVYKVYSLIVFFCMQRPVLDTIPGEVPHSFNPKIVASQNRMIEKSEKEVTGREFVHTVLIVSSTLYSTIPGIDQRTKTVYAFCF